MPDVDYYAILGVPQSVSDAELRSAYRRLVRRAHPDNGGNVDTFQLIQQAYRKVRATRTESRPAAAFTSNTFENNTAANNTFANRTTKTRRRPDRWKRMVCWSCGMRTARRPLVVVLTKLDAPDQQVDLPYCDWCWSQRVNVRDRRLIAALQTATASSRTGFALLVVAFLGLLAMIVYLRFFFDPAHSLVLLFLAWTVIVALLAAGTWPISRRAAKIRQDADDFHQRLVDHPPIAALLAHGYRL